MIVIIFYPIILNLIFEMVNNNRNIEMIMQQGNRKNSQPKLYDKPEIKCEKRICSLKNTSMNQCHSSQSRLVQSQNFTIEMCTHYLYQWRKRDKLIQLLVCRLIQFPRQQILSHMPIITFILSMSGWNIMETFTEDLAKQTLPMYLIIRWSYSSFIFSGNHKLVELWKNKLDSSVLKSYINVSNDLTTNESSIDQDFHRVVQQKVTLSNYLVVINQFYQKLFKIPEKLKKYQKSKRTSKLREYLLRINQKLITKDLLEDYGYLPGIALPIPQDSYIIMRTINEHCFPFSTKQRVPFKIVFQTLNIKDAEQYHQKALKKQVNSQAQICKQEKEQELMSLILPQSYFGEQWGPIKKKIRQNSPFKQLGSYKIRTFMVKSGDDLRQEYMAMQLIKFVEETIKKENLKLWVKSYSVIPFNEDSGLIEFVDDTRTVSFLKEVSGQKCLKNIYKQIFGINWEKSIMNFTQSLAGYSLIQYLFQIKDRHNNNILIDTHGHMIHIDFSFMISISPGNMNFEQAPFKFTSDYLEIMEGTDSDIFQHYRMQFFFGLKYIRKYKKQIMEIIMVMSQCQGIKCFKNFDREKMQKRFHEHATDEELNIIVDNIMESAWSSYSTTNYDRYQWYTNFIYN